MAKYKGLQLKKSLGQHYLHDQGVCQSISNAILKVSTENLVEVGPGAGAISQYLFKAEPKNYLGVEFDQEKYDYCVKTFPNQKFIQGDFLKYIFEHDNTHLIGNFPYNISGPIVFKILENKEFIPFVTGMFQKEVAQRIASEPKNKSYGILSVLVQCFYKVELILEVKPDAFIPPPKVDSALIQFVRNENPYKLEQFNSFKKLVKASFAQRRKTLRNNLKGQFSEIPEQFASLRAEALSPADFAELYHTLYS